MKKTRFLVLLVVLALVVAACGDNSEETSTTAGSSDATSTTSATEPTEPSASGGAGEGGNLVLLQWQAPSQANALLSTGSKDQLASSLVLEPLAEFDPTGQVVPVLAVDIPTSENGGISEDLTQITWTLQDGLLWSDGSPVTADDAVFTWKYCADEATGCSTGTFQNVESVEALDDLTIQITFTGPQSYPYVPFVSWTSPIIQQAQFADCIGAAAVSCTDQNFQPIGTGPYMVTELRPEDTVLYEMNPNYRKIADGKPFFGTVEIKGGGDAESTARSVLEIGEADYAWNLQVAPEVLGPMEAEGNGVVLSGFATVVENVHLNQTDPDADPPSEYQGDPRAPTGGQNPFFYENPVLVKALSWAINRDDIVTTGYGPAAARPICNLWPVEGQRSTTNDWCLTQDVEGANALLDENGYMDTDGDGVRETPDGLPLEFDFVTSTNAVRQSEQALIKANWEQIGVKANMSNQDAGLFFDGTAASDFSIWKFFTDIELYFDASTGPDPQGYLQMWTCDQIPTSANNWGGSSIHRFCSQEYDDLVAELAATAPDDPAVDGIVMQLDDMLTAYSMIPLVNRANVSAFSNTIQGVGDLNGWDSEFWNIEDWTRS